MKIILSESQYKRLLNEGKDYVYGTYNGETIEVNNEDWDAVPFVYFDNKVYVGYNPDLGEEYKEKGYRDDNNENRWPNFHSDISGFYKFIGMRDYIPSNRGGYEYLGRLWYDREVISFWKYPEDINKLKQILSLISKETEKIYGFKIDFRDYIIDINSGDGNNLLSIKDYIKGEDSTEEEMLIPHLMSPERKSETPQMKSALKDKYDLIGKKLGKVTQAEYNFYKNYGLDEQQSGIAKLSKGDERIGKICGESQQISREVVDKSYQLLLPKINSFVDDFINDIVEDYEKDPNYKIFSNDVRNISGVIKKYIVGESTKLYYSYFGYGNGVDLLTMYVSLFNYLTNVILKKLESGVFSSMASMWITKKNIGKIEKSTDYLVKRIISKIRMLILQSVLNKVIIHINTSKDLTSQLPICKKVLIVKDVNGNDLPVGSQYNPYVNYKKYSYLKRDLYMHTDELLKYVLPQVNKIKAKLRSFV